MKYNIINSDVYAGLINLKEQSIDVAVTSPPYWNQRDYGFKGQIGNEQTYQEYILKLVKIFNVLRIRLKPNGVFFLNIGDKYISKYGKSPLGFIPYKLVYEMIKDGWFLNDILIWYKPNHMPSSIKNRFTNSYEPIFVLSKFNKNIFSDFIKKNPDYSNILKIKLQPTPYKHVAVYPEKLVENLLKLVNLKENFTVLDPFAGSGTTLKVVKDLFPDASCYMIELNKDYIDIMIERCRLKNNFIIKHYDFIPYEYELSYSKYLANKSDTTEQLTLFEKSPYYESNKLSNGYLKITNTIDEYYQVIKKFENQSIKTVLSKNCVCFIGSKEFDLELIIRTSSLNDKNWVIRNMLVVQNGKKWFPVFMIVDDNKTVDYIFNYKNLNLIPKTNNNKKWDTNDFIGLPVYDHVSKNSKEGIVVDVINTYENNFPKYLVVHWGYSIFTKEFVILNQDEIDSNIKFISINPLKVKEIKSIISLDKEIEYNINSVKLLRSKKATEKIYNGKFKNELRINWGASPGAHSSMEKEYFSTQRLYSVDQKIVANYLNQKRIEKGLTKSEFTKLFPPSYKHTVGHWLRSDFGGSIPTPEDWEKISFILDIDYNFTKYVCSTALKLQSVMHSEYKMPDDFIDYKFVSELKKLYE